MIQIKEGDLLEATETIIGHQVNCYGAVGGLAAAVFNKYPAAWDDYDRLTTVVTGREENLLGAAQLKGQEDGHIVANLFGQFHPGQDYRPEALRSALKHLAAQARAREASVALPYKLSCGICGGDWSEVRQIIEETMEGIECTIYRRKGDK